MQVQLNGKMTAYCDDLALFILDVNKSTKKELSTASSKRKISQWLKDAFASGQIEIEMVNQSNIHLYGENDDGDTYHIR